MGNTIEQRAECGGHGLEGETGDLSAAVTLWLGGVSKFWRCALRPGLWLATHALQKALLSVDLTFSLLTTIKKVYTSPWHSGVRRTPQNMLPIMVTIIITANIASGWEPAGPVLRALYTHESHKDPQAQNAASRGELCPPEPLLPWEASFNFLR